MALINCPECNSKLSEHADLCLRCGLPRQRFAMVEAEKARLKRAKVMDESFNGISASASTAATLCTKCGTRTGVISSEIGSKCPECDPLVPGHEIFWESHAESKREAQEKLEQWEASQSEEP